MLKVKKWIVVASAGGLLASGAALACEPVGYADDTQRMQGALEEVSQATVAIDGLVVESDGYADGSIAIIRPTRIWFGPQQAEYRVKKTSDCGIDLISGESVRILLTEAPVSTSWIDSLSRVFSKPAPTYESEGFSNFTWAMRYRVMRLAVLRRAGSKPKVR